ncbi:MAG TPA: hypothetical protein VJ302_19415 [Blastocatellia bacterium]|nr:hypothetical protein [Blastocatellia bacterium]
MLYSQVCSIACASTTDSTGHQGAHAIQPEEHGHCHQHEGAATDSRSDSRSPSDSSDCRHHHHLNSLPPIAAGVNWWYQSVPPELILASALTEFSLDRPDYEARRLAHFRPPPRTANQSILRI